MKKITRILLVFSLVVVLSLAASGAAFAGKGGNPKGTITAIAGDGTSFTLETDDGPITVVLPEGFDLNTIEVGMYVVVRGDWDGEDLIYAITVRETTPEDEAEGDDNDDGDDDGEDNGNHQNVYCTGRKDRAHPMATGIAERYGMAEGEVMAMFCNGFSIGEIMLALQTQMMNGTPAADSLAQRQNGQGWGQIWRDAGLIGNADHGTPPGQADKPVNPGHGGTPPGQGGTPPGQDKRTDQGSGDDDDSGD
jgi:hypothetical protein